MLIHLDGSAAEDATSGSATATLSHRCIELLLLAHFEGNHVVSLLPDHARALLEAPLVWSLWARRALENIDESYAQIAGLREDVPWSMELGMGASFDGTAHEAAGRRRILHAKLHAFDRIQKAACSALLGENATDAALFGQLGLMMRALRRWEGTEMVHAPRGGGGECGCYVVDGLGRQALSEVVAWMKTQTSKKPLATRFGLAGERELSALADEVLAWALALKPLLT